MNGLVDTGLPCFSKDGRVVFQEQNACIGVKCGEFGIILSGDPIDLYCEKEKDGGYIILSFPNPPTDLVAPERRHMELVLRTAERSFSVSINASDGVRTQLTKMLFHVKIPTLNDSFFKESIGMEVSYHYELAKYE